MAEFGKCEGCGQVLQGRPGSADSVGVHKKDVGEEFGLAKGIRFRTVVYCKYNTECEAKVTGRKRTAFKDQSEKKSKDVKKLYGY